MHELMSLPVWWVCGAIPDLWAQKDHEVEQLTVWRWFDFVPIFNLI